MQELVLNDFTGGVNEHGTRADDFSDRQWQKLHGVVIEDETKIRSQWAIQKVGGNDSIRSVWPLGSFKRTILLALTTGGDLLWMDAPGVDVSYLTTRAATWTAVGGDSSFGADSDHRMIATFPGPSVDDGSTGVRVLFSWRRGLSTGEYVVSFDSNNLPTCQLYPYAVPSLDESDPPKVVDGSIPQANVGAMWGDFLLLGDTLYFDDPNNPDPGDVVHHPNGMWLSEPGVPTAFHPLSFIRLGSPGSRITGFQEMPAGMIVVMQARNNRSDGLLLLRGHPQSASGEAGVTFAAELLRGDLGTHHGGHLESWGSHGCMWGETGTFVFVDRRGGVWQTDGLDTSRLDEYGIRHDGGAAPEDHVAAMGSYLLLARGGKVYALRRMGDEGAWTQLQMPYQTAVRCMSELDGVVYMVQEGRVFRINPFADVERLLIDGVPYAGEVTTRNVAGDDHGRTLWHRASVRVESPAEDGELLSIASMDNEDYAFFDLELTSLAPPLAVDRLPKQMVVRGHGPSKECSVAVTWRGDVILSSVTLTMAGGSKHQGQYPRHG